MFKKVCKIIFILLLITNCGVYTSEFVITKKTTQTTPRHSRTKLKEQLGNATKDAFHASRSLMLYVGKANVLLADVYEKKSVSVRQADFIKTQKQTGSLQVTVSTLQKKISGVLECLLDNKAPFRRAGRNDLHAAYTTMHDVATSLERCKQQIKASHQECEQDLKGKVIKSSREDLAADIPQKKFDQQNQQKLQLVGKLNSAILAAVQTVSKLQEKIGSDTCLKNV